MLHLCYAILPRGAVFKSTLLVGVRGASHMENFGSRKGDSQLVHVHVDVNDFDEAALSPASWNIL